MSRIPGDCLRRIGEKGLVWHFFPDFHAAYPNGVRIAKPATVKGNCISVPGCNFKHGFSPEDGDEVEVDTPAVIIFKFGDKWRVDSDVTILWCDFTDEWETPEQATEDALEFFFGDDTRMRRKARPYEIKAGIKSVSDPLP